MRKIFFTTIFTLLSISYSFNWGCCNNPDQAYYKTKPFVYRALIPSLANHSEFYISVFVLISCIGLGLVMLYIYEKHWSISVRNDVLLIVSFSATILVLEMYKKYYDMPTAFLFMLTFILWENKKYILSISTFALLCLNRETAILIIPLFLVFNRNWKYIIIMCIIYFASRYMILWVHSDAEGRSIYMNFMSNIIVYVKNPIQTIFIVLATWGIYFLSLYKTIGKTMFAYIGYVFPVLFALYVVAGYPAEIRVFAEVMPIMFMSDSMK